ncbi:collagenase, partial [Bacillus cereus]
MNKNLKFTQLIIGMSTMALSFGSIQTQVSAEEKAPYNTLQMKPIGTETSKDEMAHATKADETLTFEERLKVGDFSQRPTSVMKHNDRQLKQSYTLAELNKMPDSQFIDTLS